MDAVTIDADFNRIFNLPYYEGRTLNTTQFYRYILTMSNMHHIDPTGKSVQQVIDAYQKFNKRRWDKLRQQVAPDIDLGVCGWIFDPSRRLWHWY